MESPSICMVRYEIECATGRSFPWAWAINWDDASAIRSANAIRETCRYRAQRDELKKRIVCLRIESPVPCAGYHAARLGPGLLRGSGFVRSAKVREVGEQVFV